MRALDTNVLVRYLVADHPAQTPKAEAVIEECTRVGEPILISVPVLCETIWVLDRVYRQSKAQVISTIELLLGMAGFRFEHDRLVRRAFATFCQSRADFADYLIGEIGAASGCRDTVTFDRALKGSSGFTLL